VRNLRSHDRRLKNSLAGMAIAANWQSDGATDDFLRQLAVSLHRLPARRVVVFAAPGVRSLTTLIVNRWADARVLQIGGSAPATGSSDAVQTSTRITYSAATSVSSRHALLTAEGPFDALIDNTLDDVDQQVARLRETLFHVLRRGVYIARTRPEPDSSGATTFGDAVAGILGAGSSSSGSPNTQSFSRDDPSYASAIGRVHRHRSSVHLSVTSSALPKTRYHEADQMMALRPDRVGSVHATRPAIRFGSACVVTANRPEQNRRMPAQFDVPAMALRSYHDVVCAPHQVLIKDGFLLPDSFRHPANARLKNHVLTDLTPLFARYPGRLAAPGRLDGDYFYLGSEYPQLFGHVMTEQLSRLWAWRDAKLAHPGLKALVPLRSRKTRLTSFEKEIFTAAGVGEADIVTTVGPVRVDHLLAASPMLVNPQYIHPGIRVQWDEVGSTLIRAAPDHETPRKIFVARKAVAHQARLPQRRRGRGQRHPAGLRGRLPRGLFTAGAGTDVPAGRCRRRIRRQRAVHPLPLPVTEASRSDLVRELHSPQRISHRLRPRPPDGHHLVPCRRPLQGRCVDEPGVPVRLPG